MKTKINSIIVFSLAFALILLGYCKRKGVEEPSPFGPSSIAVVLKLTASPNVLHAGTTNKSSTITASLKKYDGVPLANKTVHFEITDSLGYKLNLGYFEGNESVKSKTTDSSGNATVNYYGPLASDLTSDTAVYIRAKVAWDGKQFISDSAIISIVRDVKNLKIAVSAQPNSVYAGTTREQATITATLQTAAGTALANESILFEIVDDTGSKVNLGGFEGNDLFKTKSTDANGNATVEYYGPLASDLAAQSITENTTVYIRASVDWEASSVYDETPIHILLSYIEQVLDVSANPNALFAGVNREISTITATLKTIEGTPLANKTIHFEITDDTGAKLELGYFDDMQSVKSVLTDANGTATVTYYGPIDQEITANTTVYIKAHTLSDGDTALSDTAAISIIRDVTSITLDVSATPDVIYASDERDESLIRATLKTAEGTPLINRVIYFEIYDEAGTTKVNTGYFEGNELIKSVETDERGMAEVKYHGPLATEITANTKVNIKASVSSEGTESITATMALITIIREITGATLNVSADPNTLYAGDSRETSEITATLTTVGGAPLADKTVIFGIYSDSAGTTQANIGYFEGNESVASKTTDANGQVTVTYYGPLADEIAASTTAYIKASAAVEQDAAVTDICSISIIRDLVQYSISVSANPNVLDAGTASRDTSTISATLMTVDGIVQANTPVTFEVVDASDARLDIGYFTGNVTVITTNTNSSGVATVTYNGPTAEEITANTTVYIKANAGLQGDSTATDTVAISIIRDATALDLNIAASTTVFTATAARQTSTITASLKTTDGTALSGWQVKFEIVDSAGTQIYRGYFDSNEQVVYKTTDATGTATTIYYTPITGELNDVASGSYTTVYIQATVTVGGSTTVTAKIPIIINKT
ncbi:MAG: hypothetical protein JSV96_15210 [Candidatus Aminicenantes bacterium]|nr:MAG: hypothetical protein JSV96_15210 [Candidatus Aminicenantes bacterium]